MKNIQWLKISFRAAALADFVFAVIILIPGRAGVDQYVYPVGLFSAVAFSWGVMLVMAAQAPLQRRWILKPTLLVISLLFIATLYTLWVDSGLLHLMLPRLILKGILMGLIGITLVKTRKTGENQ